MADKSLDVRGLGCPLPVLKTKKALAGMEPGQLLEVLASDPGAPGDIAALCQATGDVLQETQETAGTYRFLIARSGASSAGAGA